MNINSISDTPFLAVKLKGGIGNQLFQLGFGDFLAFETGLDIFFVDDAFDDDSFGRRSIVGNFNSREEIVRFNQISKYSHTLLREDDLPGVLLPNSLKMILIKNGIDACIIDGYWQDLSYLRDKFIMSLRNRLNDIGAENKESNYKRLTDKIEASSLPVAIHVRRHDYRHHGVCHESYYIDCMRWIKDKYPASEFMVFSDEPNYTDYFMRAAGLLFTQVRSGNDLMDLHLMAMCHMHVISNSTFSWWGAVLASSRLTIYPDPWSQMKKPADTLFPQHWIRIKNSVASGYNPTSFHSNLHEILI